MSNNRQIVMIPFLRKEYGNTPIVGVEIGTLSGEHAFLILKMLNIKNLYLIDPYEPDVYNGTLYNKVILEAEKIADKVLEPYKDRIIRLKLFSDDAVSYIKELVDFVYIDGNHSYEQTTRDIINYLPLVKMLVI